MRHKLIVILSSYRPSLKQILKRVTRPLDPLCGKFLYSPNYTIFISYELSIETYLLDIRYLKNIRRSPDIVIIDELYNSTISEEIYRFISSWHCQVILSSQLDDLFYNKNDEENNYS